jgi:hypothetical protein
MGITVIYTIEFMPPRWRPLCGMQFSFAFLIFKRSKSKVQGKDININIHTFFEVQDKGSTILTAST